VSVVGPVLGFILDARLQQVEHVFANPLSGQLAFPGLPAGGFGGQVAGEQLMPDHAQGIDVIADIRFGPEFLLRRGIQLGVCAGEHGRAAGGDFERLGGDEGADAEVGNLELDFAIGLAKDQNVRRFQIPMDYRRLEVMGEADGLGQAQQDVVSLVRCQNLFLQPVGQFAAANVLVFQTRRLGAEVGLAKFDDAGVFALVLHLEDHFGLMVQQPFPGLGIETEFEGGFQIGEVDMPGPPHFAEAADAEQFFQHPGHVGDGLIAGLKARQPFRQQRLQVSGFLRHQVGCHGGAGRVAGAAQRTADVGGHLRQVGGDRPGQFRGCAGGFLVNDLRGLLAGLLVAHLGQRFQFLPPLFGVGLVFPVVPDLVHDFAADSEGDQIDPGFEQRLGDTAHQTEDHGSIPWVRKKESAIYSVLRCPERDIIAKTSKKEKVVPNRAVLVVLVVVCGYGIMKENLRPASLEFHMHIPVLIEPVPGNGYRARGGEPFATVGQGATPELALDDLKQSLEQRLQHGARLVSLEVDAKVHPWQPFAGMFSPDDPLVQEWLQILQEQREDTGIET
jgi:hypothetical protein